LNYAAQIFQNLHMKDGENNEDFKFVFPANILYVTQSYFSSNLFLSFLWKNFKEKISSAGERTKKKQKQMIALYQTINGKGKQI